MANIDWNAIIAKYDVVATTFAPIVTFYRDGDAGSDEKNYPCSIDWLLPQSTLKKSHVSYAGYNTNRLTAPTIAWFNGSLNIFFQDSGNTSSGGIMHIVTQDGWQWQSPADYYTGNNCSYSPCAIPFQNKLHLFWRDAGGNGLMHNYSTDGTSWSSPEYLRINIDNQPHGVVMGNQLYLVACDHGGNGIMYVTTTDGLNFASGYTGFNTNNNTPMTVAFFQNKLHVFFQDHNGQTIMHITSVDGHTWTQPASWNTGLYTSAGPTAVVQDNALHLFFKDASGYAIFHTVSTDGDHFNQLDMIGLDCDGQPQAISVADTLYVAAVDSRGNNGIMFVVVSSFALRGPTQQDLSSYSDGSYYLDVDTAAYPGQPVVNGQVQAPIYYTVQEADGYIDITYMMIYAMQAGQPTRALRAGTEFNCILETYGDHQGDLEWLIVRLSPDLQAVQQVGFEAHGDITWYGPGAYQTEGMRPIVRATRCGHSCRNAIGMNEVDWISVGGEDGVAEAIDLLSQFGNEWRPFDLTGGVQAIGLDANGQPINDQVWAKYRGKLGNTRHNSLDSATYVNGGNLSVWDWDYVKIVNWGADILNKIPADALSGGGPDGPGARPFVTWKILSSAA